MNYVECKVSATKSRILARSVLLLGWAIILYGCGSSEKEPTPLVTVQVAAAKRGKAAWSRVEDVLAERQLEKELRDIFEDD